LPYRWRGDALEVLLITTRGGKRWIVPKGIVEPGFSPQASAAKEALEEAGVRGDVAEAALGSYRRRKWGGICDVRIHPLLVSHELPEWAESGIRQRRWLSVPDALRLVGEEGLRTVIARLPSVAPAPGPFLGRLRPPEPPARLVYLLRHAGAAPAASPTGDHDRPLAPSGIDACNVMRRYLSKADVHPNLVLCSTARRARQTLDAVMPAFGGATAVRHLRDIHLADSKALLLRLRQTGPGVERVMVVGHNPGLRSLAVHLATGRDEAISARPDEQFPSAALAILTFRGASWEELHEGSCELHSMVAPSNLGRGA
jgi:phosphohistidine phosphatase